MAWIITRDCINENNNNEVGTGQGTVSAKGYTRFRLYDDDNNLYFEGRMCNACEGFEPLHELGYGYGCSYIKLFERGKWNIL
jgi:hypothetical protein